MRAVETSDGAVVQEFPPRLKRQADVNPANLARVQSGLYGVVNDAEPHMGTAYPVRDPSLEISGKTGTAQTGYVAKEGTAAQDRLVQRAEPRLVRLVLPPRRTRRSRWSCWSSTEALDRRWQLPSPSR